MRGAGAGALIATSPFATRPFVQVNGAEVLLIVIVIIMYIHPSNT